VTTVLVCASPAVESDLCHTPFWRDDLERYVSERADEALMLSLTTEPHVVVVDLSLPGVDQLIAALRTQSLPHPVAIVALRHGATSALDDGRVDTVLSLPSSPEWDDRLVQVLQVPTRKQARFDTHFEVVTVPRAHPSTHRGHVLNISAGGILVECPGLVLSPGEDVNLNLLLPGFGGPVEGRARVVRQPAEERIGLRFEAFSKNGDAGVRHYVQMLAAQGPNPQA
jgi:hypothetical protein